MTLEQKLDAILKGHTAAIGKTGSGKTSTLKLLIENRVDAGDRVCVLDTVKSDHWGLTSSASGKRAGLPFKILGGPHGHVPLHESAGKVIGQLVGSGKLPLSIIDMADFEPGGAQHFFVDFAQALMRSMKGVVYTAIEEAHELAPKDRAGVGGFENLSIYWMKKIATAGRSKGIRLMVATQRVQALHNAVLGSCETIIAHRLTAPADQEPVMKWLKANVPKEVMAQIAADMAKLPNGTAWVASGEAQLYEKIGFPLFRTYDNSKTPERGDHGETAAIYTTPVDQEELRGLIGEAVKAAEADDPKALRKEIATLKADLAKRPAVAPVASPAVPDHAALQQAHDEGFVAGSRAGMAAAGEAFRKAVTVGTDAFAKEQTGAMFRLIVALGAAEDGAQSVAVPVPPVVARRPIAAPAPRQRAPSPVPAPSGDVDSALTKSERAILIAVAQTGEADRPQIGLLTGYRSTARDTAIGGLGRKGYVEIADGRVKVTAAGLGALGDDYEPLPTGAALREYWLKRLPPAETKLLKLLIEAYPEPVTRADLGELAGYKSTARDVALGKLGAMKIIRPAGKGVVVASEGLFS